MLNATMYVLKTLAHNQLGIAMTTSLAGDKNYLRIHC